MSENIIDEIDIENLSIGEPVEPEARIVDGEVIPASKNRYYIDKAELTAALRVWKRQYDENKAQGLDSPQVSEYIGKCILDIATNMASKFNFRGYSFKDDMIGNACLNVLIYLHNFNPDAPTRSGVPNPFWYISRQCHNVFTKNIEYEARQQYFKYKAFSLLDSMRDMMGETDLGDHQESSDATIQDMFNDFNAKVSAYEDKQKKKRDKGKVKAAEEDGVDETESQNTGGLMEFLQ